VPSASGRETDDALDRGEALLEQSRMSLNPSFSGENVFATDIFL